MKALLAAPILAVLAAQTPARSAVAEPRLTIEQLTSIFENDTPALQYSYCQNIHDRRGLTFGFAGFTSGTYDGTLFLKEYQHLASDNPLVRYLPAFEKIDAGPHDAEGRNPSVAGLSGFRETFRTLGDDPSFIQAQQNLVDRLYWSPSQRIARRVGARLPISRGQFYDACINHGEDGLNDLVHATNRTLGGTPRSGIPERQWLAEFLAQRLALLRSDPDWRRSTDRVKVYQRLLARGNVRLTRPIRLTCYGDRFVLP